MYVMSWLLKLDIGIFVEEKLLKIKQYFLGNTLRRESLKLFDFCFESKFKLLSKRQNEKA